MTKGRWMVEMQSYELRFLGSDNQVVTTKLLESSDDASAFAAVRQQVNGQAIELWQGSRFVATIEAAPAPTDDAHLLREHIRGILRQIK